MMREIRPFGPSRALLPSGAASAVLIGALRWSFFPPALALAVFRSKDSSNEAFLYQVCRKGLVCGFVEDPDLFPKHLLDVKEGCEVAIGDSPIRIYELSEGNVIIGSGQTFEAELYRLAKSPACAITFSCAPFAGLELAQHVGDQEAELRFAIRCASVLAQQAAELVVPWMAGASLSPETRVKLEQALPSLPVELVSLDSHKKRASRARRMRYITDEKILDGKLPQDVLSKVGQQLRAMYDDVVADEVPDRFKDMLRKLDKENKGSSIKRLSEEILLGIGARLRTQYKDILEEGVPEKFKSTLRRIGRTRKKS